LEIKKKPATASHNTFELTRKEMHSTFETICNRNTQTTTREDAKEGGDHQDQCAICLDLIINQVMFTSIVEETS
jgi:hypothetical protein